MCKCPCCSDRARLVNEAWEAGFIAADKLLRPNDTNKEIIKKLDIKGILQGSCDEDQRD